MLYEFILQKTKQYFFLSLSKLLKEYYILKEIKVTKLTMSKDLLCKEFEDNEKKLKDSILNYHQVIRKSEGASVNSLFKMRSILLNWLKDSEQENLEYSRFITAKKIKYLLKNKEKLEARHKILESELNSLKAKNPQLESTLGDMYVGYDIDELKEEIASLSQSYEIRTQKSQMMMKKLEEMQAILPVLIEYNNAKQLEISKNEEKSEIEKICKGSNQTLGCLSNYYKNLKQKLIESNNLSNNLSQSSRNINK
jgi:hypothetical protein